MRIHLVGKNASEFCDLLSQTELDYIERPRSSGVIMMGAEWIEIIRAAGEASPWGALAVVLISWIRSKTSRRVQITTEADRIVNLTAEGYSAKQVEDLLDKTKSLTVVDTGAERDDE